MRLLSPSLRFVLVTVAAVAGMLVTGSLGLWQMDRARQKTDLQAAYEQRSAQPPLQPAELWRLPVAEQQHRRAVVDGQWLADRTVFLDNRPMDGRAGFFVLTPLRLAGSDAVVLVQRGWAPRDALDRTRLPRVDTPAGQVRIEGRMAPSPSKLYEFAGGERGLIRQNLDLSAYRDETGLPLLEAVLVQTGAASEGLVRNWPPFHSGVDKHHGYAAQWFALAALIGTLYVWFQFIQPRWRSRRA